MWWTFSNMLGMFESPEKCVWGNRDCKKQVETHRENRDGGLRLDTAMRPESPQIWKMHNQTSRRTYAPTQMTFKHTNLWYKQKQHTYWKVEPSIQPSELLDHHLNLKNIYTDSPKASLNIYFCKIHSLLAPIHLSQLAWHSHSLSTAIAIILCVSCTFACCNHIKAYIFNYIPLLDTSIFLSH